MGKYEREVDPEGLLSAEDRARMALSAQKAAMTRLAYRSAISRSARGRSKPKPVELPADFLDELVA
jgi:hypothetical protein